NLKLEYAAANNSFYIVRDNQLITCKADKMPVGKSPRDTEPFTLRAVDLQKGDTIYMLTDGLPDQFGGPKGKKYKYKQLEDLLIVNNEKPLAEQKEILSASFNNWKGNLEQVDDVLLIGIKI
ncbi:MAG TPA: SpoIIE family protein phosphatase, partial [Bacteroidia bacterium]|nr:SpoIIE family protein phosphatase [Bacteroidia bacterium]